MKFKLDENLPGDLGNKLRAEGHDVCDAVTEGLAGAIDSRILQASTTEGRVLLTFDLDFADVRDFAPGTHAGIVVFRMRDQRWASLERPVDRLLQSGRLEALMGGLAIVDETRIRFRQSKKPR